MFSCKVCKEKEQRIAELKEQIAYLRSQLGGPQGPSEDVPAVHLEADGVLSGQQHVITIPDVVAENEDADSDDVIAERNRLLSGSY